MDKKRIFLLVLAVFALSSSVYAQSNGFGNMLNYWRGVDFGAAYLNIYYFVDFIIYLFLFLGIAMVGLEKFEQFNSNAGKWVARTMGVAMAIGVAVWESNSGFNLGKLGILWALVFIAVIVIMVFNLFKSAGQGIPTAGAWTFLILYLVLRSIFDDLWQWLVANAPVVAGLFDIAMLFAFLAALFGIFKWMGDMFGGGGGGEGGDSRIVFEPERHQPRDAPDTRHAENTEEPHHPQPEQIYAEAATEKAKQLEEKLKHLHEILSRFEIHELQQKKMFEDEENSIILPSLRKLKLLFGDLNEILDAIEKIDISIEDKETLQTRFKDDIINIIKYCNRLVESLNSERDLINKLIKEKTVDNDIVNQEMRIEELILKITKKLEENEIKKGKSQEGKIKKEKLERIIKQCNQIKEDQNILEKKNEAEKILIKEENEKLKMEVEFMNQFKEYINGLKNTQLNREKINELYNKLMRFFIDIKDMRTRFEKIKEIELEQIKISKEIEKIQDINRKITLDVARESS